MRLAVLLLIALAVPLGVFGGVGCSGAGEAGADAPSPFLNTHDDATFVGDEACESCHSDLYASYQSHGMAQSFYPLTAERAVEDFSGVVVAHEPSGFFYVARREGDGFVQEEYRLGSDGQKTHQLVRSMDHVVGSGSAARTYLTEEGGRLYELPLTWYTQADDGRGRWDMSPGYDVANGRFDRAIPARCMACHNDVSPPVLHVEGRFASVADGIGCERCHGPGSLHVDARLENAEAPDSVDYTIVNPAHLALDLRLDVCQQCHLSGAVSILREGEKPFGYRPSEPLAAHVALYALENSDPNRVSVISHADRMKASACFVESGAMDCVTCHDPHEGFRDKGPAYFNQTCLGCHAAAPLQAAMPTPELRAQHAPTADCFSCHMPKVEADDAPHASFTDHWIRVVGAEDQIRGTTAAQGGAAVLRPYFASDEGDGDAARSYEGMAYVIYGRQENDRAAIERGVGLLAEALTRTPAVGEAQYLLGFARFQLGRAAEAIPALEEAARLGPNVPERLNTLAQAYEAAGRDPAKTEQLYRLALDAQPAAAEIRVNLGRFLDTQGQTAAAAAEYRRAARDEPALDAAHYNLGTALLRTGDAAGGEAALAEAVRLDPDHADALTNLGVLAASRGDTGRAQSLFTRAVAAEPQNANALANLGTFLLQGNLPREAAGFFERAVAANPAQVDALAGLAAARLTLGDAAGAADAAGRALTLNPRHPLAGQVMAALRG